MTRLMLPATLLLLAACSDGEQQSQPDDTAATAPPQATERATPAETIIDADMPEPAEVAPAKPEPQTATDGKTIPAAIRGRWALKPADCAAKKGNSRASASAIRAASTPTINSAVKAQHGIAGCSSTLPTAAKRSFAAIRARVPPPVRCAIRAAPDA